MEIYGNLASYQCFSAFDFKFLSPPNQGLATMETFLGLMPVLVHDGVPFKETACTANKMAKFQQTVGLKVGPLHMTCKVVYDVFYVNLQNQKNLTPAVSKKTPKILALTNRGKDPTSRPHVTLGIKGSSQWIVTGSLIAAPMHMVKTSIWAKYLDDVSGKNNLWAYKYCILPVGVKLHASRSPHLHLRIWLQAF